MAANLDVLDSVTHEHTFDEYTLSKEKSHAFEGMAKDFRSCARNGRLCEKDRNFTLLVRLFCLPLLFTTLSKAELLAAEVKQTKTKTKNKKKRDEHIACFPSRSFNYCDCGNTT